MKKIIIVSVILSALLSKVFGQQSSYWQQTELAPTQHAEQGNTSIVAGSNHTLFVGTMRGGLYRSTDKGKSWENVIALTDTAIQKVIVAGDKIYAIGGTNVYMSDDNGDTWIEKPVPAQYFLTDIEVLPNGHMLVSSHIIVDITDEEYDYFGDGILKSTDNGNTWTPVNTGIRYNKAINNIARSSTGILVASMPSLLHHRGGLYYSTNDGESWQALNNPKYTGTKTKELIIPTSIYEIHCLEFDRHDNLYFSYEGIVLTSTSSMAGLTNSIDRVLKDSLWQPLPLNNLGYDWQYHPFHSIHLSGKNDHLYASLNRFNSVSIGNSFVKHGSGNFLKIQSGIDPVMNSYLKLIYTETPDGRIYAVQLYDHKVYFTDSSATPSTGFSEPLAEQSYIHAYPNPAADVVHISCKEPGNSIEQVSIYDLTGKRCVTLPGHGINAELNTEALPAGLYVLEVETLQGLQRNKLQIAR